MKLRKIMAVAGMSLLWGMALGVTVPGNPQSPWVVQAEEVTGGETAAAAVTMSHKSGVYGQDFTLT